MKNKILQKRSADLINGKPKLPSSADLEYGELAVNYAKGQETITLKNNDDEVVEFKSKNYIDNTYYTKTEIDNMLYRYVSEDMVKQMIKEAISRIDGGIITPEEPGTPDEPETPDEPIVEELGQISDDNQIIINEDLLPPGTYTLKYIDGNDNAIDNFKTISEFTI
jgi:hypothetical protein